MVPVRQNGMRSSFDALFRVLSRGHDLVKHHGFDTHSLLEAKLRLTTFAGHVVTLQHRAVEQLAPDYGGSASISCDDVPMARVCTFGRPH